MLGPKELKPAKKWVQKVWSKLGRDWLDYFTIVLTWSA